MFTDKKINCDFLIVGAGVTGAAAAYLAAKYTDINHIVIIERYKDAALVNSSHENNAQTLHEGDTETNYSPEKARKVHFAGKLIRSYITKKDVDGLFTTVPGMVIGVGKSECDLLRNRFQAIKEDYPDLREIYGKEISVIEPQVMSGRLKTGPDDIMALYTPNRICMNYQLYARELIKDAMAVPGKKVEVHWESPLETIIPIKDVNQITTGYRIMTKNGMVIDASTVEFAAGAYSLSYAHKLGLGLRYAMLNVGGNFYKVERDIRGKVYTVQNDSIPFAAFHMDRNLVTNVVQLGPTTQIILMMIRRDYSTVTDYFHTPLLTTLEGWRAFVRSIRKNNLATYGIKNVLFETPRMGKYLVLREARKIIPDLQIDELELYAGHGGSRPQIIDLDADNPLVMGDKNIIGDRVILNTTPSPGATVSMRNALRDVLRTVEFLGGKYTFFLDEFKKDFGVTDEQIAAYAV
ncbi:FAD-dependent oxidoreductase [bacterium]|nr:MAG: FAD-dependent oxidoreductase [bacterium]